MSEETTTKEFDAKIKTLGDTIADLTLKQAVELGDYMKDTYDIEPAAAGAVMVAAAGADAADEEEKSDFDVVLKSFGEKKSRAIKTVREALGLGLKEAKELVDSAAVKVKEGLAKEEAEALKEKLAAAGAEVEIA